ncbi:D-alanine--D-alanine ligase [Marinomonas ostreistagni]|uniref:D-alanine--D-alanine ligase n=1 Tax=Marinomonas ostreistagni TaxID=359209 RepID=UPI00194DFFFC|nr:D-alanine--D-alanine ligase [Marinomonas ostreistagni]MBM6549752.1 D-alanine--D-alanine ligase [Marinomonas ostreistagni]
MTVLQDKTIAVVYGGRSAEREVSLESGTRVAQALLNKGYQVVKIDLYGEQAAQDPVQQLASAKFDLAFIALHGGEGEDGRVQALLDMLNKPYTGSLPLASGFAMDKALTKRYWQGIGIATPKYLCFSAEPDVAQIEQEMRYPLIIKPSREGSTIGISKVNGPQELAAALIDARRYDSDILVEEFVSGPEFTVTVINDKAYPAIGLKPSQGHALYDYEAKYLADDTAYLLPCGLASEQEEELKALALEAYRSLGCRGWGRVDVMQTESGAFTVLEVNTSPGMTSHSLVPMAAAYEGIAYDDLVEMIALNAWQDSEVA